MTMNVQLPKARVTFSLDADLVEQFERAIPKSKRSGFVQALISDAMRKAALKDTLEAMRSFKPYPLKGPGVVETIQKIRAERVEHIAVRHRPSAK